MTHCGFSGLMVELYWAIVEGFSQVVYVTVDVFAVNGVSLKQKLVKTWECSAGTESEQKSPYPGDGRGSPRSPISEFKGAAPAPCAGGHRYVTAPPSACQSGGCFQDDSHSSSDSSLLWNLSVHPQRTSTPGEAQSGPCSGLLRTENSFARGSTEATAETLCHLVRAPGLQAYEQAGTRGQRPTGTVRLRG